MTLERSYDNPVVIAHVATENGAQPVNVRVSGVNGAELTLQLQEPNHLDGAHVRETVNYMVVEAGTWVLPDGTLLEAGTLTATSCPRRASRAWPSTPNSTRHRRCSARCRASTAVISSPRASATRTRTGSG